MMGSNLLRVIVIGLDHLPPSELNPNKLRRLHWTKRSEFSRVARAEMFYLARQAWMKQAVTTPIQLAEITYYFTFNDKRKHDGDNLLASCKAYTDGLVDAGVIARDDLTCVKRLIVEGEFKKVASMTVTVRELK